MNFFSLSYTYYYSNDYSACEREPMTSPVAQYRDRGKSRTILGYIESDTILAHLLLA